jgi:hypothetical protein
MEAHPGVMRSSWVTKAHHGDIEAHPRVIEAHPGLMEVQPWALDAYLEVVSSGILWSH